MKFNIRALALASAILWGGCVLLVGVANLICAGYGQHFLEMLSSFYPGYHATRSFAEVAVVTFYAIVDGLVGGLVFGWLYNRLARPVA
jgi:site-specific recombinase